MMVIIFAVTLFWSAALLFLIQPMFGKMVLPLLGGSPAVWNTEVAFCQGVLLLGYLYAHLTLRWMGVRKQALVQALLVLIPVVFLPVGISSGWDPPAEENPVLWLLFLLSVSLGIPLFVVATVSPVLQKWFSSTAHSYASDPYFLYAASNAGSLIGLLAYPILLERYFDLGQQSRLWSIGYGGLVLLMLVCTLLIWKSPVREIEGTAGLVAMALVSPQSGNDLRASTGRRVRWVLWAFVPSSWMLSVTSYLSTNIAPVPLLWVIPLSLYLITLILAFSRKQVFSQQIMIRLFPMILLPLVIVILLHASEPMAVVFPLHLAVFFVSALVCHRAISNDRPATEHLTEFYFWVSLGGVLGGTFNGVLAPLLFSTLVEYPLVLVLSALLLTRARPYTEVRYGWTDLVAAAFPAALAAGMILALPVMQPLLGSLARTFVLGIPAVICYTFSRRPLRFGLALAGFLTAGLFYGNGAEEVLHRERNFFGIHAVLHDERGAYHVLSHGGTVHGRQSLSPARQCEPLSYYHPTGPLGQVFRAFQDQSSQWKVAAVGLGAGSVASYKQPDQEWIFYEIDPAVIRIASDPQYFTYLTNCIDRVGLVMGDARLSLSKEEERQFDLLILDAYSSDSIPIHLITQEALELYLNKIRADGLLVFHISNRYLDLEPVVADLAEAAGLICLVQNDLELSKDEKTLGKEPSQWAVMARTEEHLGSLARDLRWRWMEGSAVKAWSDRYSSVLSALKW